MRLVSRRPFIVAVGATRVRAVGTQFDVYKKSNGTVVTVVEGRVAVWSKARLKLSAFLGPYPASSMPFAPSGCPRRCVKAVRGR